MANVIAWFEIPVADMFRAKAFYHAVLGSTFDENPQMEGLAFFHVDGGGVGGHLQAGDGTPSDHGPLIYLDPPAGVTVALGKVEAAGGNVLQPSTPVGSSGYIGILLDTEGNRVGLYSGIV